MDTNESRNAELDGGMFAVFARLAAGWKQYLYFKLRDATADEFMGQSREQLFASAFGRSKE